MLLFPSIEEPSMSWQPSASLDMLKARAAFYGFIRQFFELRQVMEVETPLLSKAGVSDPYLYPVKAQAMGQDVYLHTSPEYPMKRLLAAGSGDIYQICKVFRDQELGARHNPEFTMLEYYRLGFSLKTLMDEVAQLVGDYLNIQARMELTYQVAFQRYAQLDPFTATDESLLKAAQSATNSTEDFDRAACLDILMTHSIEPALPHDCLVFIVDYPADQAALAKVSVDPLGNAVAQRFELYVNGMELANGYDELSHAQEQRDRFERDQQQQRAQGLVPRPIDEHFLSAMQSGLPECSGVAIGVDRILMLRTDQSDISRVVSMGFHAS